MDRIAFKRKKELKGVLKLSYYRTILNRDKLIDRIMCNRKKTKAEGGREAINLI